MMMMRACDDKTLGMYYNADNLTTDLKQVTIQVSFILNSFQKSAISTPVPLMIFYSAGCSQSNEHPRLSTYANTRSNALSHDPTLFSSETLSLPSMWRIR